MIHVVLEDEVNEHKVEPGDNMCGCKPEIDWGCPTGVVIYNAFDERYKGKWLCLGDYEKER